MHAEFICLFPLLLPSPSFPSPSKALSPSFVDFFLQYFFHVFWTFTHAYSPPLSLSTGFTTTQFFWRLFNSKRHFLVRFSSAEIFTLASTLRSDSRYRSANEQESFFVHIFAAPLCVPSLFGVLMIIHTQKTFVPFLFFLLLFLLLLFLLFFLSPLAFLP